MPVLDLPEDQRSKLWAAWMDVYRNDPVLTSIGVRVMEYDGQDNAENSGALPWILFAPGLNSQQWAGPQGIKCYLVANVTIAIPSQESIDYLNMVGAIENAAYPRGDFFRAEEIRKGLVAAGARTGEVEYSAPPNVSDPRQTKENVWVATGQLRIELEKILA